MRPNPNRQLFPIAGSKWTLAPRLVSLLPPHEKFIDLFGCSASIWAFGRSEKEVFNDVDPTIYSIYNCLQHPKRLAQLVRLFSKAKRNEEHYYECFNELATSANTVRTAYCFLYCSWTGFRAAHPLLSRSFGRGFDPQRDNSLRYAPAALEEWAERFRGVALHNRDALELIEELDDPAVCFFVDPPYILNGQRGGYLYGDIDHARLLRLLNRIKGKAVITHYPDPTYEWHLREWQRVPLPHRKTIRGREERTEVVWISSE